MASVGAREGAFAFSSVASFGVSIALFLDHIDKSEPGDERRRGLVNAAWTFGALAIVCLLLGSTVALCGCQCNPKRRRAALLGANKIVQEAEKISSDNDNARTVSNHTARFHIPADAWPDVTSERDDALVGCSKVGSCLRGCIQCCCVDDRPVYIAIRDDAANQVRSAVAHSAAPQPVPAFGIAHAAARAAVKDAVSNASGRTLSMKRADAAATAFAGLFVLFVLLFEACVGQLVSNGVGVFEATASVTTEPSLTTTATTLTTITTALATTGAP